MSLAFLGATKKTTVKQPKVGTRGHTYKVPDIPIKPPDISINSSISDFLKSLEAASKRWSKELPNLTTNSQGTLSTVSLVPGDTSDGASISNFDLTSQWASRGDYDYKRIQAIINNYQKGVAVFKEMQPYVDYIIAHRTEVFDVMDKLAGDFKSKTPDKDSTNWGDVKDAITSFFIQQKLSSMPTWDSNPYPNDLNRGPAAGYYFIRIDSIVKNMAEGFNAVDEQLGEAVKKVGPTIAGIGATAKINALGQQKGIDPAIVAEMQKYVASKIQSYAREIAKNAPAKTTPSWHIPVSAPSATPPMVTSTPPSIPNYGIPSSSSLTPSGPLFTTPSNAFGWESSSPVAATSYGNAAYGSTGPTNAPGGAGGGGGEGTILGAAIGVDAAKAIINELNTASSSNPFGIPSGGQDVTLKGLAEIAPQEIPAPWLMLAGAAIIYLALTPKRAR